MGQSCLSLMLKVSMCKHGCSVGLVDGHCKWECALESVCVSEDSLSLSLCLSVCGVLFFVLCSVCVRWWMLMCGLHLVVRM